MLPGAMARAILPVFPTKIIAMSHPFRYYLRVRYGECDPQKVVFNANYAAYVDVAFTEFLRVLGYGEAIVNGTFDTQVVKQTVEWKAAAHYDEVLEITVSTTHLGNTSFALGFEIRRAGEPAVLVSSETVYVYIDPKTMSKKPMPPEVREALERGAPDTIIDHAGYLQCKATAGS